MLVSLLGTREEFKDDAIADFNVDHMFVMAYDDFTPLMPSLVTNGWVTNGGFEYNDENAYWIDPLSEFLPYNADFEVVTASDAPQGQSYARVTNRSDWDSRVAVNLQVPGNFDPTKWIQVRYWGKFAYKDAVSDAAATGEDRHHYLYMGFKTTYDTLGDGNFDDFTMRCYEGCIIPDGKWRQYQTTCNIQEKADANGVTLGTVTALDWRMYNPLPEVDLFMDDVQISYFERDRSWVPGANMRIEELRTLNTESGQCATGFYY